MSGSTAEGKEVHYCRQWCGYIYCLQMQPKRWKGRPQIRDPAVRAARNSTGSCAAARDPVLQCRRVAPRNARSRMAVATLSVAGSADCQGNRQRLRAAVVEVYYVPSG
eukprot:IDg748t1